MSEDCVEFSVINCIHQDSFAVLVERLYLEHWRIFELEGETVKDKSSFLKKAGEQLPHEPGLIASSSWDAFNDTLFSGLVDLHENRIAILWTGAHRMLEGGLPDLLMAVDCFKQMASDFITMKIGSPTPVQLAVFLVGEGDNFKPLQSAA